jgi:hypothetical protein
LSQNYAHWLLGVAHYEWNELDTAVYHFSAVITNQHLAHFWMVQDAMRGLALAYQDQGLGTKAQEIAHALLELVQGQHNMGELVGLCFPGAPGALAGRGGGGLAVAVDGG